MYRVIVFFARHSACMYVFACTRCTLLTKTSLPLSCSLHSVQLLLGQAFACQRARLFCSWCCSASCSIGSTGYWSSTCQCCYCLLQCQSCAAWCNVCAGGALGGVGVAVQWGALSFAQNCRIQLLNRAGPHLGAAAQLLWRRCAASKVQQGG